MDLTEEEIPVLDQALVLHLEGTRAAKTASEQDPTFADVDTFSEVMQQYDEDIRIIEGLRKKVNHG